ncbi:methyltransferase domain-containing protein [Bacillus sp. FSL L8-0642]|uniref:class I SAM-dependent methyltransferase n=1 Tax=Bacillus sp. FSL L8-0642 TaxID=2921525 RepID=UPI0030F83838
MGEKKLHLGCGRTIIENWINLDVVKQDGVDVVANLDDCKNKSLPFENDSIDEFLAEHLLEHIQYPLFLMEELHRIAKPDAKAVFKVPYGSSDSAFEDPTHVRQYFLHSFDYFCQPCYWRADYGYRGDWLIEKIIIIVDANKYQGKTGAEILDDVNKYRNIVLEMVVELRAIKPIREPQRELLTAPPIEIRLGTTF